MCLTKEDEPDPHLWIHSSQVLVNCNSCTIKPGIHELFQCPARDTWSGTFLVVLGNVLSKREDCTVWEDDLPQDGPGGGSVPHPQDRGCWVM